MLLPLKRAFVVGVLIIAGVAVIFAFALFRPIPPELSIQAARAYGPLPSRQFSGRYDIAIEFAYAKKGDVGVYCFPQININSKTYTGTILYEPTGYFWADAGTKHGRSVAGISPETAAYSPRAEFRLQCNGFSSPWKMIAIPRFTADAPADR